MSPEELKAHARRVPDELLTQGDLAVADAVFAPDLVHHGPIPRAPGVAGTKQLVLALRRAFPDLCATVEDEIAEGDRVVQRLTLSGTHRGEYCGLPPTGRHAIWQLVDIQRIGHDGKVAEHWSSPDLFGLLRQLGALPNSDTAWQLGANGEGRMNARGCAQGRAGRRGSRAPPGAACPRREAVEQHHDLPGKGGNDHQSLHPQGRPGYRVGRSTRWIAPEHPATRRRPRWLPPTRS